MGYSESEKKQAIQEVVQGTLTFPSDRLGPRDLSSDYNEVMELVHSAFLYEPDAIFYLIYLVRNTLNQILQAEIAVVSDLLDAVDDLAQPNKPIESVSGLTTARNALLSMDSSLGRGGGVGAEEYRKYTGGVARMKDELAKTVRMSYTPRGSSTTTRDIVRASPEAAADTGTYFASLKVEHQRLLAQVSQIASSFSEFMAGKLPAKVAARQISRAATQLDDLADLLEPLTPYERTAQARSALLKVLSNESVLLGIAGRTLPGTPRLQFIPADTNATVYRLDAYGEGTPATILCDVCSPYPLYDGNASSPTDTVGLTVNGESLTIDLFPSETSAVIGIQPAELTGSIEGPFAIHEDIEDPYPLISAEETYDTTNNGSYFYIMVDGALYWKQLTQGAARTATQVASDINSASGWLNPGGAKPPVTASVYTGFTNDAVQLDYSGSSTPYSARYMEVTTGFDYAQDLWNSGPTWQADTGSGLVDANRTFGWDGNDELWIKGNDEPDEVKIDLPNGTFPDFEVDAGPVGTSGTVGYAINSAGGTDFTAVASASDSRVTIQSELEGEGSIITILSDGLYASGQPASDPKEGAGTPSYLGARTLGFVEHQEDRQKDIDIRSVINILNDEFFDTTDGRLATATSERTVYLHSLRAYRYGDTELRVEYKSEDGSLITWGDYTQMKVAVENGDNRGIYGLTQVPAVATGEMSGPGDQKWIYRLFLDRKLRDDDSSLWHEVTVYSELLRITSTDAGITGSLFVGSPSNDASPTLGLSGEVVSTVSKLKAYWEDPTYGWKDYDLSPCRIKIGDKIRDDEGTELFTVTGISEVSDGIISVTPEAAADFSTVDVQLLDWPPWMIETPEGFSIDSFYYLAYLDFVEQLSEWISDLSPFEEDLSWIDRALEPVLLITPTKGRVDIVYSRAQQLETKLSALDTVITSFSVPSLRPVDTALQTLLEQGFDRARTLLLEGKLEDFWDLTVSTSSFARNFHKAVNEFMVEDANNSSAAWSRDGTDFQRLNSYWEDDNPEMDFSDMEEEFYENPVVDYYPGDKDVR